MPNEATIATDPGPPVSARGLAPGVLAAGAAGSQPTPGDPRAAQREALLHGPVLPTLLRLGLPTIAVLLAQTVVAVAETYWTSFLGTEALAGVALVFPVLTLMATMSNGGIGGGVSSAVARAIGAGRRDEADALLRHALVLAVVFGALFTTGTVFGGRALYAALGGKGPVLDTALLYSGWVFAGAVPIWAVNLLAAALRGAGEVRLPARVTLVGAAVLIPLSPALIFGLGPVPRMGVAGAGLAVMLYYLGALAALMRHVARGHGALTLRPGPLRRSGFGAILGVGLVSALGTLMANLTTVLVTGAVGLVGGADALAGYGVASRLDWLLIPLLFGLGTAVVTMVGVATGAGQHARACRVAWTAAGLAAGATEAIGLVVAIFPDAWMIIFSADPAVVRAGAQYLRIVAPLYGAVGVGMVLYFARQGMGRMLWPFLAGATRLLVAGGGAWLLVRGGAGLASIFAMAATASALFGLLNAAGLLLTRPADAGERAVRAGPANAEKKQY